jgi:predicted Zn-ribbon and HTH transcriptional regulator
LRTQKCPVCDEGVKVLSRNIIQEKLNRKYLNQYTILSENEDINSKTKILVNDNYCKHDPWLTSWDRLKQGNGCPKCAHEKNGNRSRLTVENISKKLENVLYDDYELLNLNEYIDVHTKNLKVKHLSCNQIFLTRGRNLFYNKNLCPYCIKSKSEIVIEEFLKENNFRYKIHYKENDLKGIKGK